MVFGLFGVASAAKFTDDSTIQYKTAVGTMTGIGAINGYTDGTFAPKSTITREEATKMITYAILGPTVAKSLTVSSTSFKDVEAARWSAPFISYCESKGIINGMGDGTFAPTANVTGYQLGKMLLAAAGYGKQGEFTGASWELNVAILASKLVFTDSKATSFSTAATREEAALYVYNALVNADQVVWDKTTDAYKSAGKGTIAKAVYGLDLATATSTVKTDMITGYTQNADKTKTYVTGTGAAGIFDGSSTYVFTPAVAQYGHKVDLYTGTSGAVYFVDDACTEYVVPATVTSAAALKVALTKFNGGTMVTYANATNIPLFTNSAYDADGYTTTDADIQTANHTVTTGNTFVIYKHQVIAVKTTTKAMEAVTVSIDKDKNVIAKIGANEIYNNTKAYIATYGVALNKIVYASTIDWTSFVVGYDATSSVTQTGVAYFTREGLGTTNYALATKIALTDITKVAGTATAVNVAGNKLTVNGTSYYVNVATGVENTGLTAGGISANFDATLLSGSYKFWINNLGKVFYIQTVTASDASSYAPSLVNAMWKVQSGVDAYGVVAYKYYAQVVTTDGKVGNYEISTSDGLKPAEAAVVGVSYDASSNDFTAHYYFASVTGTTVAIKTANAAYTVATVNTQTTIAKAQVVIGSDMYFTGASAIVTVNDIAPANAGAAALVKSSAVVKSSMEDQTFTNQNVTVVYKTVSGTKVVSAVFVEGTYAGVASDIYFIAKFNGQISAGTTPTYSYTAIKLGAAAPVNLVFTTSTGAGLVGTFKSIQTTATGDSFTAASTATLVASGAMCKVTANTSVVSDYYLTLTRGVTNKLATTATVIDLRAAVQAGTGTAYTNVAEIPVGTIVFVTYPGATAATQTSFATIFVVDGTSAATIALKAGGTVLVADAAATVTTTNINVKLTTNAALSYVAGDYTLAAGATAVFADVDTSGKLSANDTITVTALDGTVVVYKFVDAG